MTEADPSVEVIQELLPCPFCGGEGTIEGSSLSTLSWPLWAHKDGCPLKAAAMYPNREAALKAGNTRHDTSRAASQESERLRAGVAEAAAMFRYYEQNHRDKADPASPRWAGHTGRADTLEKAERNRAMAEKLETLLKEKPSET